MTSTSAKPGGSSNSNPVHGAQSGTGRFMLTLCRLAAPLSARSLQSPRLKPFTFFMSRARRPDGRERLYLHMGFFEALADAERWLQTLRRCYPNAFATLAPIGFLQPANSEVPSLPPGESHPPGPQSSDPGSVRGASLSDSQVLRILETRRVSPVPDGVDERNCAQIELLRPDDTGIRQALKEAVVQGAPVYFAVQLYWSVQPIDLGRVPSLALFKTYTLYGTETRREGRAPRYFLRLGFFPDPISAKQVAVQVCSIFASAAVVPVLEQEVTRARDAATGSPAGPYLMEQGVDRGIDSTALSDAAPRASRGTGTVEQTLEPPAEKEISSGRDLLNDSGVRHLRIEVQEQSTGRWRIVRLASTPSNRVHVYS